MIRATTWITKAGGYTRTAAKNGLNVLIYGANKYLNFGTISGVSGYGFRDYGGVMQYRNSLDADWKDVEQGVGGGVTVETPTGAINAVNASFNVSAVPKWVVADGIINFDGAGYSIAGLVITMDVPPSQYIRAII